MAEGRSTTGFCFVHAADLHLDTPFKGVGQTNASVAETLREASLLAFSDLVSLCIDRRAEFLLLSGDIYDGAERGIRAQLHFREGLLKLSRAGIATFVVHGNHDPLDGGWSAISEWPPLVSVFGSSAVEAVPVLRAGEQIAIVQGISYGRRDVTENLALRFERLDGPGLKIGVLHCNVTGVSVAHDNYSPCSLDDLQGIGLDYWALGHIHARVVMSGRPCGEEPWVVYPGNLQGRSTKESERGAKGAVVVSVEEGRVAAVEFVACDRVRFGEELLDGTAIASLEDLREELVEAGRLQLAGAEGRSVILRARLTGACPIHHRLRPGVLQDVLTSLRDDFVASEPWLWWSALDDCTVPVLDLDEVRRGSDFAADLVTIAEAVASGNVQLSPGGVTTRPWQEAVSSDFVDALVASLPRSLRQRARGLACHDILGAGLNIALNEIGTSEPAGAR
ncbi:MAG: metallophosphoesterase family protein [Acidimicrobiales bacterium]